MARQGLRKIVAEWLERALQFSRMSQAAAADKAKIARSTVNRIARERVDADVETIQQLEKVTGYPFPDLEGVFRDQQMMSPRSYRSRTRLPQDERSDDEEVSVAAVRERGSYAKHSTDAGIAAWLALGTEMQHNLAVKVIKEALEAQDFAGSPVLRALHGIAQKMDEMGYTAMSRHIWAEMGKYFGQQLPPGDQP